MTKARFVPGGQVQKLDAQECGLQTVESGVDTLDDVVVLRPFTVVAQPTGSLDDDGIVRRDHAAVAIRAEVFARVEAEAGELAEGAAWESLVKSSVRLRRVLHNFEVVTCCEFEWRLHLGGLDRYSP